MQGVVVLLGVSIICFIIFQYMGSPVLSLVGKNASQKTIQKVRERLNLDEPFYMQYFYFIKNAVRGDFGESYVKGRPALGLILARLPATAELASTAIVIAMTLGIGLGVLVSIRPKSIMSRLVMAGSLLGISIPTFLTGLVLILLFAVYLGVLPPFGRGETVSLGFWRTGFLTIGGWKHLILPAFTLGLYSLAMLLRLTKAEMIEVLSEDYIKTARAKGLRSTTVIFKHALRNGLAPVLTMAGLQFGQLIAFAIITETIFQWPGMGRLLLSSIYNNDRPVIVTYIILAAVVILSLNLLVDILYAFLDPKVQYE